VSNLAKNRKKVAFVIILLVIITVVGILTTQEIYVPDLEWAIKEDQEYKYMVKVYGYRCIIDPENISQISYDPPFYTPMNNTKIIMNISSLPSTPLPANKDAFAERVIEYMKTACRFENESAIPLVFHDRINQILSHCLLPIGNWEYLDSLYPNEIENPFFPGVYISKKCSEHFEIGHILWTGYGEENWYGNVSLTLGIPISAESFVDSVDTGARTRIRLILI
jgi:hypothetical protein